MLDKAIQLTKNLESTLTSLDKQLKDTKSNKFTMDKLKDMAGKLKPGHNKSDEMAKHPTQDEHATGARSADNASATSASAGDSSSLGAQKENMPDTGIDAKKGIWPGHPNPVADEEDKSGNGGDSGGNAQQGEKKSKKSAAGTTGGAGAREDTSSESSSDEQGNNTTRNTTMSGAGAKPTKSASKNSIHDHNKRVEAQKYGGPADSSSESSSGEEGGAMGSRPSKSASKTTRGTKGDAQRYATGDDEGLGSAADQGGAKKKSGVRGAASGAENATAGAVGGAGNKAGQAGSYAGDKAEGAGNYAGNKVGAGDVGDKVGNAGNKTGSKIGDAGNYAGNKAGQAGNYAGDKAEGAGNYAGNKVGAGDVGDKVGNAGNKTGSKIGAAKDKVTSKFSGGGGKGDDASSASSSDDEQTSSKQRASDAKQQYKSGHRGEAAATGAGAAATAGEGKLRGDKKDAKGGHTGAQAAGGPARSDFAMEDRHDDPVSEPLSAGRRSEISPSSRVPEVEQQQHRKQEGYNSGNRDNYSHGKGGQYDEDAKNRSSRTADTQRGGAYEDSGPKSLAEASYGSAAGNTKKGYDEGEVYGSSIEPRDDERNKSRGDKHASVGGKTGYGDEPYLRSSKHDTGDRTGFLSGKTVDRDASKKQHDSRNDSLAANKDVSGQHIPMGGSDGQHDSSRQIQSGGRASQHDDKDVSGNFVRMGDKKAGSSGYGSSAHDGRGDSLAANKDVSGQHVPMGSSSGQDDADRQIPSGGRAGQGDDKDVSNNFVRMGDKKAGSSANAGRGGNLAADKDVSGKHVDMGDRHGRGAYIAGAGPVGGRAGQSDTKDVSNHFVPMGAGGNNNKHGDSRDYHKSTSRQPLAESYGSQDKGNRLSARLDDLSKYEYGGNALNTTNQHNPTSINDASNLNNLAKKEATHDRHPDAYSRYGEGMRHTDAGNASGYEHGDMKNTTTRTHPAATSSFGGHHRKEEQPDNYSRYGQSQRHVDGGDDSRYEYAGSSSLDTANKYNNNPVSNYGGTGDLNSGSYGDTGTGVHYGDTGRVQPESFGAGARTGGAFRKDTSDMPGSFSGAAAGVH